MPTLSKIVVIALSMFAAPLQAHEFWIDAEDFTVASGEAVTASFRNGENMVGSALSYIPAQSARFDMVVNGKEVEVPTRIGNNPAFNVAGLPDGLLAILHETTDQSVTYTEWEKWVAFTDHKDFAFAQQAHIDRGLSQDTFRENYRRYAKALIAVGDGSGEDRLNGLKTEIVAGLNPYTDDLSGGLPVQVFLDGVPIAEAQFEMFERDAAGQVVVTRHKADDQGRATLPMMPGRRYLIDSVQIEELEPANEGDAGWLTHWAALTFAVPEA